MNIDTELNEKEMNYEDVCISCNSGAISNYNEKDHIYKKNRASRDDAVKVEISKEIIRQAHIRGHNHWMSSNGKKERDCICGELFMLGKNIEVQKRLNFISGISEKVNKGPDNGFTEDKSTSFFHDRWHGDRTLPQFTRKDWRRNTADLITFGRVPEQLLCSNWEMYYNKDSTCRVIEISGYLDTKTVIEKYKKNEYISCYELLPIDDAYWTLMDGKMTDYGYIEREEKKYNIDCIEKQRTNSENKKELNMENTELENKKTERNRKYDKLYDFENLNVKTDRVRIEMLKTLSKHVDVNFLYQECINDKKTMMAFDDTLSPLSPTDYGKVTLVKVFSLIKNRKLNSKGIIDAKTLKDLENMILHKVCGENGIRIKEKGNSNGKKVYKNQIKGEHTYPILDASMVVAVKSISEFVTPIFLDNKKTPAFFDISNAMKKETDIEKLLVEIENSEEEKKKADADRKCNIVERVVEKRNLISQKSPMSINKKDKENKEEINIFTEANEVIEVNYTNNVFDNNYENIDTLVCNYQKLQRDADEKKKQLKLIYDKIGKIL